MPPPLDYLLRTDLYIDSLFLTLFPQDIVNFGIKHKVDFIAASFVRKAADVTNLRKLLAENNGQEIKIICKIENQEGLENYDAILQATDGTFACIRAYVLFAQVSLLLLLLLLYTSRCFLEDV